jgi:hypothetical protein
MRYVLTYWYVVAGQAFPQQREEYNTSEDAHQAYNALLTSPMYQAIGMLGGSLTASVTVTK